MDSKEHKQNIIEQFSKQAIPFTKLAGHFDAMQLLVDMSKAGAEDNVLDVACGPGLVACEFARYCAHVTGVDITPEMIKQAKISQSEKRLGNMSWDIGEAYPLPYEDDTFSLVITRYSFHHFHDVRQALAEMMRVCKPGGRVLVADVGIATDKSEAYDKLEMIRDHSHVHALTTEEFEELFMTSGLHKCRKSEYGVDIELEAQIAASFPKEEDVPKLRAMVTNDIGKDRLGINARRFGGDVIYTVPVSVYTGYKI
ncbi:MAG: class I SAM-dependent methyltransferase [Deferribacterales bacterium]